MGDCISAKVESGIIKEKDEVILMPMNVQAIVKSIEVQRKRQLYAGPGVLCEIALHLPSQFDANYLKAGNVLCDKNYPIN